ncbi:uncharacterized protein EI97DRAFT_424648 [Westerdykella ornata]|uniref:Uncharacterized protein n=1 Tax=Westerdykella ornata TaxID=318751 RepID=A0A6A6JAT6_WESOR|nr:uncharacterized protein EI97DRAFT_424648 [Westerdykella ornata]KAF2273344.1 hypothetical protein EI97DRAFT_424648 [Westerdykella ornata]
MPPLWNALIRTHHITSRKKVSKLRAAAAAHNVFALLRSGGCPGIMYCEGSEMGVRDWVATVQRLRYKDYQLVIKPGEKRVDGGGGKGDDGVVYGKLEEIESVKVYGAWMKEMGLWGWWRKGMGYAQEGD